MLELLDFTHDNIIATKADRILQKNDYEKIRPLIHNIICTNNKVRWYFESTAEITATSQGVQYSTIHFIHALDFEKIAIVGSKNAEKFMRSMMNPFTQAIVLHFDLENKDEGIRWIMA